MSNIKIVYNFEDILMAIIQSPVPLKLKVSSFKGSIDEVEIDKEERSRLLEKYHKGEIIFQINAKKEESEFKILRNL